MNTPLSEEPKPFKILHITRNLPPLVGGMEKLNWHMAQELSDFSDVRLIGPNSHQSQQPEGPIFFGIQHKPIGFFFVKAFIKAILCTRGWNPNYVLAGSGLMSPIAFIIAKLTNAKSATYIHGLDITVNHIVYKFIWLPMIKKMDLILANSQPTAQLARNIGIPKEKIFVVHPGAEPKKTKNQNLNDFRKTHNLEGLVILLSVGRLAERKGIFEFVRHSLPKVLKKIPNAILVIIGDSPSESLHAKGQSIKAIMDEAHKQGISNHIKFLGRVSDDTLVTAYQVASVHVFPVKHNPQDPEGFGMVAIEAAAHGVPTAAFATGGVIDAVSHGVSGLLAKPGDYGELTENIVELATNKEPYKSGALEFSKQFTWKQFGKNLQNIFTSKADITLG
jgi:phosphatidylinositol alpha-1,6-mannosyltransferase